MPVTPGRVACAGAATVIRAKGIIPPGGTYSTRVKLALLPVVSPAGLFFNYFCEEALRCACEFSWFTARSDTIQTGLLV